MNVKAIETRYAGHRFRSRLEARWAVLFDAAGIQWEYEVEGWELPSGRYLPDFWLPQVMMWAEVKPTRLSGLEFQRCRELAIGAGFDVLLLDGKPERRHYSAITVLKRDPDAPQMIHYDMLWGRKYWEHERRFFFHEYGKELRASVYHNAPKYWCDDDVDYCPLATAWVDKALSARFEFGEVPCPQ